MRTTGVTRLKLCKFIVRILVFQSLFDKDYSLSHNLTLLQ